MIPEGTTHILPETSTTSRIFVRVAHGMIYAWDACPIRPRWVNSYWRFDEIEHELVPVQ